MCSFYSLFKKYICFSNSLDLKMGLKRSHLELPRVTFFTQNNDYLFIILDFKMFDSINQVSFSVLNSCDQNLSANPQSDSLFVEKFYPTANKFNQYINFVEFYSLPIIVLVGFFGNTLGSLCILRKQKLRKHTSLFIVAVIGIIDIIFLTTQLQRWFTISHKKMLVNIFGFCKIYFFLLRMCLISSIALNVVLTLSRFIKVYFGGYYLSLYSNVGQICSRLSVVYILVLAVSGSWYEVWSSGVANNTAVIESCQINLCNNTLEFDEGLQAPCSDELIFDKNKRGNL